MQAIVRDHEAGCWYAYAQLQRVLIARQHDEVSSIIDEAEQFAQHTGGYAVGFVSYEAAAAFDPSLSTHPSDNVPYALFGLFGERKECTPLSEQTDTAPLVWQLDIDRESYHAHLTSLHKGLLAGDYYQVNFSARCHAQKVSGIELFAQISQDALYGAYLSFADDNGVVELVSASPELFFTRTGEQIVSRPMKGTAARGTCATKDRENYDWLAASEKNRAENLMITDMVRNDLGRIAQPGTVQTRELFEIEAHPAVWQMTSTVQARTNTNLSGIFKSLFPAASITGAPKHASMAFIAEHEDSPRGIYTGAIGVIAPNDRAVFSVAIRTAYIQHDAAGQDAVVGNCLAENSISKDNSIPTKACKKLLGRAAYGVGGGIVADSKVAEEYGELLAKTQILNTHKEQFELLETMRLENAEIYLLDQHLQRLSRSAEHFGYAMPVQSIRRKLKQVCEQYPRGQYRLRLLLDRIGGFEVQAFALQTGLQRSQSLVLAKIQVDRDNLDLQHKTTRRTLYESAAREAPNHEVVLTNLQGNITETAIANVVYEMDGRYLTPPLSDGLLPGTLRGVLLAEGKLVERSLHKSEMHLVTSWHLVSALRGWRPAHFFDSSDY